MADEIVEMHAIVSGNVQGVGFRWTVSHHAEQLNLKGTVRNVPNGTVEIFAQGSRSSLNQLLERLHQEFGPQYIQNIDTKYSTPAKQFSHFSITR